MKIRELSHIECIMVRTDNNREYIRFGDDDWFESIDDSIEPLYSEKIIDELEDEIIKLRGNDGS